MAKTAEREGFEPSVPRWGHTRFPGEPVRPLRHLSKKVGKYTSIMRHSQSTSQKEKARFFGF